MHERVKVFFEMPPARHRCFINGAAHLRYARCFYRSPVVIKFQTGVVPRQTDMIQHAPGLSFDIVNHVFISDIDYGFRGQHVMPVLHHLYVMYVIISHRLKVVGEIHDFPELSGIAGKTGIHGVAHNVDGSGIGKHEVYETQTQEVCGHLVGNS